jgi:hypothetical protein
MRLMFFQITASAESLPGAGDDQSAQIRHGGHFPDALGKFINSGEVQRITRFGTI